MPAREGSTTYRKCLMRGFLSIKITVSCNCTYKVWTANDILGQTDILGIDIDIYSIFSF